MSSGRTTSVLVAVLAVCAALPATASASGSSSSAGGVVFVETPKIAKVACVKRCATRKRLQGGSTARISGSSLGQASTAIFHGSNGADDDVRARVKPLGARRARARVPPRASAIHARRATAAATQASLRPDIERFRQRRATAAARRPVRRVDARHETAARLRDAVRVATATAAAVEHHVLRQVHRRR